MVELVGLLVVLLGVLLDGLLDDANGLVEEVGIGHGSARLDVGVKVAELVNRL